MQLKKIIGYISAKPKNENQPGSFGKKLLAAQRKAADYLNKKTTGWSPSKTKTILILFCLIWMNIILLIAGRAILCANGPPGPIKVQWLFMHAPLPVQGDKRLRQADSLSKQINH